jgi:hypothetical protein
MNRFLKYWRLTGCVEAFRANVIAYADDFVILNRGLAAEALGWTKVVMARKPHALQSRTLAPRQATNRGARDEARSRLPSRHLFDEPATSGAQLGFSGKCGGTLGAGCVEY